ncbi:hypothetical protein Tco_0879814 [Tanacetum coccineum]
MAVPGRRNGMIDGDEDEDGILFVEEGALPESDFEDTPLHLRDLAAAAMHGDVDALRQALGIRTSGALYCLVIFSICVAEYDMSTTGTILEEVEINTTLNSEGIMAVKDSRRGRIPCSL